MKRMTATSPTSTRWRSKQCKSTTGPATCASCKTTSNGLSSWHTGDELTLDLLPKNVTTGRPPRALGTRAMDFKSLTDELVHKGLGEADEKDEDLLSRIVEPVERRVIAEVMTSTDGVQIKAAARLGNQSKYAA